MSSGLIAEFVSELKSITVMEIDPAEVLERVTPVMKKMAKDTSWVRPEFYEADEDQGFGITILNEEDDHSLLVEAICWLPGKGVAPHDHHTWGIVVGIDGVEINVDWDRMDDGGKPGFADLKKARETSVEHGVIVSFMPDDIHSVRNDAETTSLSLHVYGVTPSTLPRSEFDPINKTQKPCPQRKRTVAAE
ncbi:MAG: cysteine dioxygenase family protein [Rhodospirillaceae bacterium]|nr:cysteine dioxygenase family protein [Rhodospirillaceae bacterium]